MKYEKIQRLAEKIKEGKLTIDEFVKKVEHLHETSTETTEAVVDIDRHRRCGFPEVIYSEGKSKKALIEIFTALRATGASVLATRMSQGQADAVVKNFPEGKYNAVARTFRIDGDFPKKNHGKVIIVSAGTTDLPVAEEAKETALWAGCEVDFIYDVGVAGPHRLYEKADRIRSASAIVVVAGMEGALPSVVGGYVSCPVVAVPTSVGYGASFHGITALLGMLNSCASNVTVVNIDAGFKGGYVAALIAKNAKETIE